MTSPKKILFILPDMNAGGAERLVSNLINFLQNQKEFSVHLLLLRKEGYYLEFLPKDLPIIVLNKQRIRQSIWVILKNIHQLKPDIVFSGFGEVNAFISPFIPLFRKSKFIARETNIVSEHVQRKSIRFFYSFYNRFHAIIAQSNDMKEDLVKNIHINPKKISHIPNPVNVEFIEEKMVEFSPEEFSKTSKNVLAIGNLSYRKGFDLLLKVFTHLKEENIELYIIGEGPQKEEFQDLKEYHQLEKVHFLGTKKNPYPYLKHADLFVLSSRYEGFPNVLLEAGVCETYSVANNCKGGIEEIIQPEINGTIADITKTEEFAEKIRLALKHNSTKEQIKDSIVSRYNQEKIFAEYLHLFQRITNLNS